MGGREAVRGFSVQTLICLLDSMRPGNDDWEAVTLEPDSSNEKVDIFWELAEGKRCVQQVKSSQNQIGRGQVESWCRELKESGSADRYQLILAAPVAASVLTDAPFDGVEVPVPASLDTLALLDQAITGVDRYLTGKGIAPLPLPIRETLIYVVSARLLDGSVRGVRLARKEFDGWLLQWIIGAYPQAVEQRMAANCDVLWSSFEFVSPREPSNRAFELALPLTVVNGGISTTVVEWFLLRVSAQGREMRYIPVLVIPEGEGSFSARREAARPFGDYAVCPQQAVHKTVLFAPIERVAYMKDEWPRESHEIELFVKYSGQPTPRSVKKVPISVTIDESSVLGTSKTKHARVSNIESYLDVL